MADQPPFNPIRRWLKVPRHIDWLWWLLTVPVHPVLQTALWLVWLAVVCFFIVTIINS